MKIVVSVFMFLLFGLGIFLEENMNINTSNLFPVQVENFYAYPQGHKHYGKLKLKLNKNPYKVGEEIAIDTEGVRIEGTVEFIEGNVVVIKMSKLIHKELPS